jgi:hypothetical protein
VRFKWTDTLPHENAIFWGLWDEGFNWDRLRRFIAGSQPPTKPVPARSGDLRAFAKKAGYKIVGVWNEIAPGPKQERAERKKVLALAQAGTVDLILVTELTRWGRSATFAARSLTCFKFRFVSSPHLVRLLLSQQPDNTHGIYRDKEYPQVRIVRADVPDQDC